jgi:hypothetical protein
MEFDAIFIVGFIVLGIYKTFELFVRRNERIAVIEKLSLIFEKNESPQSIDLPNITFGKKEYGSWALRISLLLIGIGAGCLLSFIIQISAFGPEVISNRSDDYYHYQNLISLINFACIALLGGLGLLSAYFIELKQRDK